MNNYTIQMMPEIQYTSSSPVTPPPQTVEADGFQIADRGDLLFYDTSGSTIAAFVEGSWQSVKRA